VNTIFEVVKASGRRTAWSDKHTSYDLVNGPSGTGVDDLYTPEINSDIASGGVANGVDLAGTLAKCDGTNSLPVAKVQVYTDCIPSQEAYDDREGPGGRQLDRGKHSDGAPWPRGEDDEDEGRVPAIFGMNFQAVSVGQKLPVGGYQDAAGTPSANLANAIAHTDRSIGRMVAALAERDLLESTLIIVTAKHGQSPIDRSKVAMEGGGHAPVQTVQDPNFNFVNNADPNVDNVVFTNNNTVGPTQGHTYATNGTCRPTMWASSGCRTSRRRMSRRWSRSCRQTRRRIFANRAPPRTPSSRRTSPRERRWRRSSATPLLGPVAAARAPNVFIQPDAGVIYSGVRRRPPSTAAARPTTSTSR